MTWCNFIFSYQPNKMLTFTKLLDFTGHVPDISSLHMSKMRILKLKTTATHVATTEIMVDVMLLVRESHSEQLPRFARENRKEQSMGFMQILT